MSNDLDSVDAQFAYDYWSKFANAKSVQADPLAQEVATRHAQTLEVMNVPQGPILDVGCGVSSLPVQTTQSQPNSVWRLDWVNWHNANTNNNPHVVADAKALPFKDDSFAFVWSNLSLPWFSNPSLFFTEAKRVLIDGGLVSITSLGPDSLASLVAFANQNLNQERIVINLMDMHNLTDMAVAAGFAEPVSVRDNLRFSYASKQSLLTDITKTGALASYAMEFDLDNNANHEAIDKEFAQNKDFELEFEVIYLHAWAIPKRKPKLDDNPWQEITFNH